MLLSVLLLEAYLGSIQAKPLMSTARLLRGPSALLRRLGTCSGSLVDRVDPGTRGGIDVPWTEPEAINVRFYK